MEIVIVRHAEPDWEPGGRTQDDPPLTDYGRRQAALLAEHFAGEAFDHLYVSSLVRAKETAAPIAARLGMKPQVCSWLAEHRLPKLEGRTPAEVQEFFRAANRRELDQWWEAMPGGESLRHFHERVASGIEGLLEGSHGARHHEEGASRLWNVPEHGRPRLLIVAHWGTNSLLISHLLGIEPVPWLNFRFACSWAGITRMNSVGLPGGSAWSLDTFNTVDHLAPVLGEGRGDGRGEPMIQDEGDDPA